MRTASPLLPLRYSHDRSLGQIMFWWLMVIIVSIKLLYLYNGPDLFSEEAQYWLWSRHIDWAYYSKPPLIAYVNYLTTNLFGVSALTIRLGAILCGLGASYQLFRLVVEQIRSHRVGLIAIVFLNVSPFFVTASLFFTTDSLLIFCWAGALRYLLRFTQTTERRNLWYVTGFVILGMLAKPTMLLFGVVVVAISYGDVRTKLAMCFGLAAGVGSLPLLIWNSQHEWVTFRHLFQLAGGKSTTLIHPDALSYLLEYTGGQLANGSVFILIAFVLVRPWQFHALNTFPVRVLWLTPLVLLAGFGLLSLHTRVEVNWPAAGLLSWPVVAAYGINLRVRANKLTYTMSWPVVPSLVVVLILLHPTWLDTIAGQPIIPVAADPMHQLAGWDDAGRAVGRFVASLPAKQVVLVSDSYHVASELAFYIPGQPQTYCLPHPDRRLNQFDFWPPPPLGKAFTYVFVSDGPMPLTIRQQMKSVRAEPPWPVHYRATTVRTLYVYVSSDYRPDIAQRLTTY